jgi:SAM-dependent methyltransferase
LVKTDSLKTSMRAKHEFAHGKRLASGDTEAIWGWGTPAGRIRSKRRADLITKGACLRHGTTALEIGCGTGMFTAMFAENGAKLVAVDISPDLLEKARNRGLAKDRVQFIKMRFEDANLYGPFDAVIGSSVLHHLDVPRALAKIHKLLRPGGYMAFAEPNILNPQVFCERTFSFLPCFSYVSPDETAFVRWRLRGLLLQTGFDKVEITPFDWLHPATPVSLIGFVRKLGGLLEKIPAICEFAGSLFIKCRRPAKE